MASDRKLRSNRSNSRKSTGPKTAGGKAIAARNSTRHGLAALSPQSVPSSLVADFVNSACEKDPDPQLIAAAITVARYSHMLGVITDQQTTLVERLREPHAQALAERDNSYNVALARSMQAWLACHEIEQSVPKLLEKYKDQLPPPLKFKEGTPDWITQADDIVPIRLKALLTSPESIEEEQRITDLVRREVEKLDRDDGEALEAALPDLVRLERYYGRTWTQYKRAVRHLMFIKSTLTSEQSYQGTNIEAAKERHNQGDEIVSD